MAAMEVDRAAPPATAHLYAVSAHRPTTVTHTAVGAFTAPGDLNLVLARGTRIEVHKVTPEGLQVGERGRKGYGRARWAPCGVADAIPPLPQGVLDVPIYGRVATMRLLRLPVRERGEGEG